ncbi:MAG TPA: branched-chain amino acid ABC transporter permease [Ktedonobacterales bacterium]
MTTNASAAPTSASPSAKESAAPRESREWLWSLLIGLALLGLIATIPLFGDRSLLRTWTVILMFCVLAQSWDFIGGFTGYSAFGNVAFFGIGAYTIGLWLTPERPFWVGLVIGAVAAGVFAVAIGLPVLRLKGHYFAIATLGTAEALRQFVAVRNVGGPGGLVSLPLPSLKLYPAFFYGFLGLSLACLLTATWLTRGRFGYALVAIRENEQAAEALGITAYRYKVAAFALSAIPAAIAGGLYAWFSVGFEPSDVFGSNITVEMVLLAFLGGRGTILGPLLGGIAFEWFSFQLQTSSVALQLGPLALDVSGIHNTLLGLTIVIVAIFLPQGFVRLVQEFTQPAVATGPRANRFVEGARRVRRFIAANGV